LLSGNFASSYVSFSLRACISSSMAISTLENHQKTLLLGKIWEHLTFCSSNQL
jgi:hypothetical protein